MAIDMEEVVGAENMKPEARDTVVDLLNLLPLAAAEIKSAFFAWARQSGHTPTSKDAAAVGVRKKRKPA
jgi:hypothetical protein